MSTNQSNIEDNEEHALSPESEETAHLEDVVPDPQLNNKLVRTPKGIQTEPLLQGSALTNA